MVNPIINRTINVPAAVTGVRLDVLGKHVKIVSCTVASVLMGFGDDTPERVYADDCYAGPEKGFKSVRFVSDLGACTVVIQVTQQPIMGGTSGTLAPLIVLLTAVSGFLSNIWTRFSGASAATDLSDVNVDATGGAGTLLFAANAARKSVEIQALDTNGGKVYIGSAATVSDVDKRAILAAGDSWYSEHYTGAVYAVGSDGLQSVCGTQE